MDTFSGVFFQMIIKNLRTKWILYFIFFFLLFINNICWYWLMRSSIISWIIYWLIIIDVFDFITILININNFFFVFYRCIIININNFGTMRTTTNNIWWYFININIFWCRWWSSKNTSSNYGLFVNDLFWFRFNVISIIDFTIWRFMYNSNYSLCSWFIRQVILNGFIIEIQ